MPKTRHQREVTEDPSPLIEYTPPKRVRQRPMANIAEENFEIQDPLLPQHVQDIQEDIPGPRDSPNNPFGDGVGSGREAFPEPGYEMQDYVPSRSRSAAPRSSQARSSRTRSRSRSRSRDRGPSEIAQLAEAIRMLVQREPTPAASTTAPARVTSSKIRNPDPFDGSDPEKLSTFVMQCKLVFRSNPGIYATDSAKVYYALSYLRGTALKWFEPVLLRSEETELRMTWKQFVSELEENFGVFDPEGEAESKLRNLTMSSDKTCAGYLAEFQRLAADIKWNEEALVSHLYHGLPTRLKDKISDKGKPSSLARLRHMIQVYDHRYWERQEERRRERGSAPQATQSHSAGTRNSSSGSQTSGSHNHSSRDSNKGSGQGSRHSTPNPRPSSGSSGNPGSSGSPGSSGKPSSPGGSGGSLPRHLSGKLDSKGKLTPEERKRRFENNLCMFCAKPGHQAKECPNPNSSAAKARAASVGSAPVSSGAKA